MMMVQGSIVVEETHIYTYVESHHKTPAQSTDEPFSFECMGQHIHWPNQIAGPPNQPASQQSAS